jgi:hypothetical protein
MKKIIIIIWLSIWFMPFTSALAESNNVSGIELGLECLCETELANAELSEIAGQGSKVSIPQGGERESAKIIFWDEAQSRSVKTNLSTGYGNSQRNTLSVQAR